MAKPIPLDPPVTNAVAPLRFIVQSPDDVACRDVSTAAERSAQKDRRETGGQVILNARIVAETSPITKKLLRHLSNRTMVGQDVDETFRRQPTHKRIETACGADTEPLHKPIRCTNFLKCTLDAIVEMEQT